MNDEKRTHPVIWLLFVLMLILVVDQIAEASGDRIKQSNDVSVGGDDSTAVAFGHALGDVDINDCLASTAWGTILISRQGVILNKWCAAEVYDAKGLPVMAARMRCDIPEVRKHFNTDNGCISANTAKASVAPVEVIKTPDKDEEGYHEALEARLAAIEAQSSKDTERARRAAKAAQAAAEEAHRLEQERKEYAQQTLEQLQEYRK
jgi:hypothetical protein